MIFVIGFILLPLVVQAQEITVPDQPPIIALNKNKLHAVSPQDGSAQVIVQPAEGEVLVPQLSAGAISPDGKWLVYAIFKQGETPKDNKTPERADRRATLFESLSGEQAVSPAQHAQ